MQLDSVRELKASLTPVTTRSAGAVPAPALGVVPAVGRGAFRLAVRVQDRAQLRDTTLDEIERAARGEVDVRHVGRIVAREAPPLRTRRRPLVIGASLGHFRVTAGTLGAVVSVSGDDRLRLLSNNHVLADEDAGVTGDAIIQPGAADGGRDPADRVAELAEVVALTDDVPNLVDAALAVVLDGIDADPATLTGLGRLAREPLAPAEAIAAAKVGRTTGLTRGEVTAFELDGVQVAYTRGTLVFDDQIEVSGTGSGPFSQGGDSGSLVVSADARRPVGLLFAGGEEGGEDVTYLNPIAVVLDALGATLRVT